MIKLTKNRKKVLNVIKSLKKPSTAKVIQEMLLEKPDLSTIYRTLEFLTKNNIINSVSFNGKSFYYFGNDGHFIVCKECEEIMTFNECVGKNITNKIEDRFGYKLTNHILYFQGYCSKCYNTQKKEYGGEAL